MTIEVAVLENLNIINFFLEKMKMKPLDEQSLYFVSRKTYVIKYKEQVIGFICFMVLFDEIDLEAIYIESNFRKKGYGHQLINLMMQEAMNNKCRSIFLEVRESNRNAIGFYYKNGFYVISCRKQYYGNENGLIMKKELG